MSASWRSEPEAIPLLLALLVLLAEVVLSLVLLPAASCCKPQSCEQKSTPARVEEIDYFSPPPSDAGDR